MMIIRLFILLTILFGFLMLGSCSAKKNQGSSLPQIDSKIATKFIKEDDYIFLDVRSIKEHKVKAIPNTPNIPVQELENRIDELEIYRDKKIVVYCRSGNRSKLGTDILNKNGYDAVNLIGGMIQWDGPIISEINIISASEPEL